MIAKGLDSGNTGWFAQNIIRRNRKNSLFFPDVITIRYLLGTSTRK